VLKESGQQGRWRDSHIELPKGTTPGWGNLDASDGYPPVAAARLPGFCSPKPANSFNLPPVMSGVAFAGRCINLFAFNRELGFETWKE
jgi:hypothetical protein